jgi:DNA-binding NarL/FixJ family response regulator
MIINVAIIEGDCRCRAALAGYLSASTGFHCAGSYEALEPALGELPCLWPDVILFDIELAQQGNWEALAKLREIAPGIPIVMLVAAEEPARILRALSEGACGYFNRPQAPASLLLTIAEIARGGSPVSSLIARQLVGLLQQRLPVKPSVGQLSLREREVLECLAKGFQYKQIAEQMTISIDTVRTYIRRLYAKLQVGSRTQAVVKGCYEHSDSAARPWVESASWERPAPQRKPAQLVT